MLRLSSVYPSARCEVFMSTSDDRFPPIAPGRRQPQPLASGSLPTHLQSSMESFVDPMAPVQIETPLASPSPCGAPLPAVPFRPVVIRLPKRRRSNLPLVLLTVVTATAVGAGGAYLWIEYGSGEDHFASVLGRKKKRGQTDVKSTLPARQIAVASKPPTATRRSAPQASAAITTAAVPTTDKVLAAVLDTTVSASVDTNASMASPAMPQLPTPAAAGRASPVETADDPDSQWGGQLAGLRASHGLLNKKEYPKLRKLFADRFARLHAEEIDKGLGANKEAMQAWFQDHSDVRDELYTAIDPKLDKTSEVLRLFSELKNRFPQKLAAYGELAIATALVWDVERRAVYDYAHHARRCKAIMPPSGLNALENFDCLVATEPVMQGRIQYVPWEFLVHVVNHRTPQAERVWAMQNYLAQRQMFGKCYSSVPYDQLMLKTDDQQARLNNKEYNLPNLLAFGGVCAMQADFAARVGKSIGVASEYVRGQAADGEGHAWVMWVELKQATPTGLVFSLESHGRYREDRYYVGHLEDPHTGKQITDRDLELRLHMAGMDTLAKRQASLAMQSFPTICEQERLDVASQLDLLSQIITFAPGCEDAWYSVARLARDCTGQKQYAKQFGALFDRLFLTFARFPDFTWKVFNDLAVYQADIKLRNALYEKLVWAYENAGRPDLACEARLKMADLLVDQKRPIDAIEGLAFTIRKFPGEGRYLPKMLDRIESLSQDFEGADQRLVQFYAGLLPLIPKYRGDDPSPFAIQMFRRAANVFMRCNQPQLGQAALLELQKLQAKTPSGLN
jgi:hypothetical protein